MGNRYLTFKEASQFFDMAESTFREKLCQWASWRCSSFPVAKAGVFFGVAVNRWPGVSKARRNISSALCARFAGGQDNTPTPFSSFFPVEPPPSGAGLRPSPRRGWSGGAARRAA